MKRFLILAIVLLAGCETMPQSQAYRPTAADDPTLQCFASAFQDPRLNVLKPQLGSLEQANSASIAQLASTDRPNSTEKEALSLWGGERQRCLAVGRQFRQNYAPSGYATAFENGQSELVYAIARLYGGELTYGQFNAERNRIAAQNGARMDNVRANQAAQLAAEQARRSAAIQMMLQQQQQNRPITTDCNRFGNSVSCTTR